MNQRINWIDSAKGIGILLVVLGHSTGNIEDPLNKAILSFHMPLFFFLSGLCSKQKEENKGKQALRKAYSLLLPNITLGILLAINQTIRGGGVQFTRIIHRLVFAYPFLCASYLYRHTKVFKRPQNNCSLDCCFRNSDLGHATSGIRTPIEL